MLETLIQKWVPPILTGVIGLFVGMMLSTHEAELEQNKFFLEKQAQAADNIAKYFSAYIENWRRLRLQSAEFSSRNSKISQEEREIFLNTVRQRNVAKDNLFSSLDLGLLYFDEKFLSSSKIFRDWDNAQAVKTLQELPKLEEWHNNRRAIFSVIREEMIK